MIARPSPAVSETHHLLMLCKGGTLLEDRDPFHTDPRVTAQSAPRQSRKPDTQLRVCAVFGKNAIEQQAAL